MVALVITLIKVGVMRKAISIIILIVVCCVGLWISPVGFLTIAVIDRVQSGHTKESLLDRPYPKRVGR